MPEKHTKGEMHGCIVCGKLYQMYVIYDPDGKFVGSKIMSAGGRSVHNVFHPLVACATHSSDEIKAAVDRVFGPQEEE
jgi:hypothetical protein